MLPFLPPTFKSHSLATNQIVTGCEKFLQKVLLFASVYAARFTGPRHTCFAASNVTPLYSVTPA